MTSPRLLPDGAFLTAEARRTLRAVASTFLPAMVARGEEDPELFALQANSLGIAEAMEEAVAGAGRQSRRELALVLMMLASPAASLALIGRATAFAALSHADRERYLRAMAESRIPHLRSAFQALKRLSVFFFYSAEVNGERNPTWRRIGYAPSPRPAPHPAHLRLTQPESPDELRCDVVVVGSGAGGSIAASALVRAGLDVVVLEAGPGRQAPEYPQREMDGLRHMYEGRGLAATDDLSLAILAGTCLGGGTTVNWQTSFRTPDLVLEEWAERSGCSWLTESAFGRSMDEVWRTLRVSAAESVVNPNNAVIRDGCEALGYRWSTITRNAEGCDPRQCGYCVFGCRHGGKRSAVRLLEEAQREGSLRVIPGCRAERVRIEQGRARAVTGYIERRPGEMVRIRVHAGAVVVAAGAIHSPLLLMRSGVHNPHLGRHLTVHPTTAVAGRYEERIETWTGPPQTVVCDEFAWLDGGYGVRLEAVPAHPGLIALATPWTGARDHRLRMQHAAHVGATIVLGRDASEGRVRADRDGLPLIEYHPGRREQEHLKTGIAAAARIHAAAGAREIFTLHTNGLHFERKARESGREMRRFLDRIARAPVGRNHCVLFSAHQMGTCRMGSSVRESVCGPDGQVHGVEGLYLADASVFPGSSGVNPMLTIMALAHHTAGEVASALP